MVAHQLKKNSKKAFALFSLIFCFGVVQDSFAKMSSDSYEINADSFNTGGDLGSSTSYKLNDTMGEVATGVGSSATYKMKAGFQQMVNTYLVLTVDASSKDLGSLLPGSPITGETSVDVTTDAWNGYALAVSKDHKMLNLEDESTTIDDHNGTIAMPLAWSAPNNTGFGFTIVSGTDVDIKWTNKYAAFPDIATEAHARTGYKSAADETVIGYKVDAPSSQKSGSYSATITYTAVGSI
jgi:hypothetical protein